MATDEPQRDGERQSDLAVMDANEYKQKRRLERILDALDSVQDKADEAWNDYSRGEITREAVNIVIQRSVKNAIRECYKLLRNHAQSVDGRDRYWAGDPQDPLGVVRLPNSSDQTIIGLRAYLESKTFYTATFEQTVERRNMPNETVTEQQEVTMPEDISYRAFLLLKEFLDDVHDMEISFEEMEDELPNWGFDSEEEIPDDAVVL